MGGSRLPTVVGALAVLIAGYCIWASMGRPVQLQEDGYQMTVALFRVCNQKDQEGLEKIRQLVQEANERSPSASDQMAAIESIIRLADAGDWGDALKETRDLMEGQVRY